MSRDPRWLEKRKWRLSHPESVSRSNRKQYLKKRRERLLYQKRYNLAHRSEIKTRMRAYYKRRYANPLIRSQILEQNERYARAHPVLRLNIRITRCVKIAKGRK
jgi:hypothetical protein